MSKNGYNADQSLKNTPLRLDELEAYILAGSKIFKSPENISHFLQRVEATLKENRRRMIDLQNDVDKMKQKKREENHPIARALDALNALSDEDKKKILDLNYLSAVEKLKEKELLAERTRIASVSETNRMRLSFSKLSQDPTIPLEVREKIKSILEIK